MMHGCAIIFKYFSNTFLERLTVTSLSPYPEKGRSIFTPKSGSRKYEGDGLGIRRMEHKEYLFEYWTECNLWYRL